jgi:3-oxoacyl-[acyl-carrier protein] reductase
MNGRIILLTGANGGLGQAIAQNFLQKATDDFVWLGVHKATENASLLAKEFSNRCALLPLDVTRVESWETAIKHILQQHQRIDVLVNNAGRHRDGLLATLPQEAWDEVLSTNLDSVYHGCRAVLPAMISQRFGRIINIASLSALLAPVGQTNYAAAKAGVVALTQALAKEVARIGITVNAICPGYIETEALKAMTEDERKAAQGRIPMRRFGRPDEVAAAVHFLACAEASYITGSALKIDGGIL